MKTSIDNKKYDVFLSYASEDENEARHLYQKLTRRNIKVWFDSINIESGENILFKIDEGLEKSRKVIALISESYCKKEWTTYESSCNKKKFFDPLSRKRWFIPVLINKCKGFDKCEISNNCPRNGIKVIDLYCKIKSKKYNIGFKKLVSSITSHKTIYFLPPLERIKEEKIIKHYESIKEIVHTSVKNLPDYLITPTRINANPFANEFEILETINKATIVIVDITHNNPSISYLLAIRKSLNKPVIILQPFDFILDTPYLSRDFITEYDINKLNELENILISKIKVIEKNFDEKNEFGDSKKSNNIAELINKNKPKSRTPEQIAKIEESASEIWILTSSLQKDIDGEDIQETVEYNLSRGKKYTYFLPFTEEVRINLVKFKEIHNEAITEKKLSIIPILDESYRLFEEIAIYSIPGGIREDIKEGYTMITLENNNVTYLKMQKKITDRIYKTFKKLKDQFSVYTL